MFFEGVGSRGPNPKKAFEYYSLAVDIDGGNTEAWRNLAHMYLQGIHVPKDEVMAKQIYSVVLKDHVEQDE